jgi:hypothetical protein
MPAAFRKMPAALRKTPALHCRADAADQRRDPLADIVPIIGDVDEDRLGPLADRLDPKSHAVRRGGSRADHLHGNGAKRHRHRFHQDAGVVGNHLRRGWLPAVAQHPGRFPGERESVIVIGAPVEKGDFLHLLEQDHQLGGQRRVMGYDDENAVRGDQLCKHLVESLVPGAALGLQALPAHPAGLHLVVDQRDDLYLSARRVLQHQLADQLARPHGCAVPAGHFDIRGR